MSTIAVHVARLRDRRKACKPALTEEHW